jgi:hypothetical protein
MKKAFVFATACNKFYADEALNLVGSIQHNSDIFSKIYVYDLGMSRVQKKRLQGVEGVEVVQVPPFTKFWKQCWSWKSWVWVDASKKAESVLYLDAGVEVLRDLASIKAMVENNGYFVVSQHGTLAEGHTVGQIIPKDYYKKFSLSAEIDKFPVVAGGLVGFKRDSVFYKKVILETLELTMQGYNVGWSPIELFRNKGFNYIKNSPVRDCPWFRHDQTLLNMFLYTKIKEPVVSPMDQYGGTSSEAHPDQFIWNSRKTGKLPFIGKLRYKRHRFIRNSMNVIEIRTARRLNRMMLMIIRALLAVPRRIKRRVAR